MPPGRGPTQRRDGRASGTVTLIPRGENVRAGKDGLYRVAVDVAPWRAGADVTYRVEVTCR